MGEGGPGPMDSSALGGLSKHARRAGQGCDEREALEQVRGTAGMAGGRGEKS